MHALRLGFYRFICFTNGYECLPTVGDDNYKRLLSEYQKLKT